MYDKYKEIGAHAELKWIPNQGHGFYEGTDLGIKWQQIFFLSNSLGRINFIITI